MPENNGEQAAEQACEHEEHLECVWADEVTIYSETSEGHGYL